MINAGTQPIQNLSVLNYYSSDPKEKGKWARHFIDKGLKGELYTIATITTPFSKMIIKGLRRYLK